MQPPKRNLSLHYNLRILLFERNGTNYSYFLVVTKSGKVYMLQAKFVRRENALASNINI